MDLLSQTELTDEQRAHVDHIRHGALHAIDEVTQVLDSSGADDE